MYISMDGSLAPKPLHSICTRDTAQIALVESEYTIDVLEMYLNCT